MEQVWLNKLEKNKDFTIEDLERVIRYSRDLVNGLTKIKTYPQGVTIFGSARLPETNKYYIKARELGQKLAQAGHPVISGGGKGIMEAANRGAFEVGGRSIGLNIELPREQSLNGYTTDSLEFHYFFARKVMLTFSSKVYVYFPGGFGTVDELSEILTLMETGKVTAAPIFLFGSEFWKPLDKFFAEQMETIEKTISPGDRNLYKITDDIDEIVQATNTLPEQTVDTVMQRAVDTVTDHRGTYL